MNDVADRSLRQRLTLIFVGLALGGACGLLRVLRPDQPEVAGLLIAIGAVVIAWPIVRDALAGMGATGYGAAKFYMDQFITLAVAACFATGRYVTGGVVALILVVGQLLEERSVLGVREAVESLLKLSRVRARRLRDGREEEVDATELAVGDRVRVLPGETVPADGCVQSGTSTMDQAHITGESLPVEVEVGGTVFAGTVNVTGSLEVEVTRTGDATVIGRVRQIVEEAQQSRAPIVRLTEEYARYYTPLVLLIAGFVLFFTRDFDRAIAVIIVSIPCAFVLAGPSAMVAALATASRLGILVKSVRFFEAATTIDTVVFDKTGTLTTGQLSVQRAEDEALALAAAAARHSTHPVSRAVVATAERRGLVVDEATGIEELPGRGLRAVVGGRAVRIGRAGWLRQEGVAVADGDGADHLSALHVAADGRLAGVIYLADTLRGEAKPLGAALRAEGVEQVVMLTGDRAGVARMIAAELEIDDVRAECLPEQKLAAVNELKEQGRQVLVLGDGVNDAPALAAGHVGVAMGALGSDVAIRTADVALMSGNLARLPQFLALSRRTVQVINQNMLWGLAFIALFILGSSFGFISPIMAAVLHEFSAFFVIFNSARLLRFEAA
jgi:Cd2+/Zn2+-exporting ATPase